MSRGHGKKELIIYFGNECMLGGTVTNRNPITYHHINKKCNGGRKSMRNGALVSRKMHQIMNIFEFHDKEFYNQIQYYLQCYKIEDKKTQELLRELAREDIIKKYKIYKK